MANGHNVTVESGASNPLTGASETAVEIRIRIASTTIAEARAQAAQAFTKVYGQLDAIEAAAKTGADL